MVRIKCLEPDYYVEHIAQIDVKFAKKHGIEFILFDLDNTVCTRAQLVPDPEQIAYFSLLAAGGIKTCIVSNNNAARVAKFSERLGVPYVSSAIKPLTRGILNAMRLIGARSPATLIVGDQLFTDILGGKRAKILTCFLTVPLDTDHDWLSRAKRLLEGWMFK